MKKYPDLNKRLKIAIFSGAIPSSTFIEYLIVRLSQYHDLFLFGVVEQSKHYTSKSIYIYKTPYSHWVNLGYTLYRIFKLGLKSPNDLLKLFQEVKSQNGFYNRWIKFSKFLPIILYHPDIFHIQWARDLEYYSFLKTKFHIPIVVSLRGAHVHYTPIIAPYIADVYRFMFPQIDAFHAVSEYMSKEAQRYGANLQTIKVIHSPLPDSLLQQYLPHKRALSKSFKIGTVGRFHWVKGMRYAFDACAILQRQHFDYRFTFVSSNAITEEALFQIDHLELQDDVQILSSLDQDALFEVMRTFDVLLLSSLNEGIANVVLEAMALGIPVISTDCGGMPEVVIPKETGWLIPVRDAEAIANAVIEVSKTSETELQRITKNAHDFVKAHFNAEDSIGQFLELYGEVYSSSNGKIPTH